MYISDVNVFGWLATGGLAEVNGHVGNFGKYEPKRFINLI